MGRAVAEAQAVPAVAEAGSGVAEAGSAAVEEVEVREEAEVWWRGWRRRRGWRRGRAGGASCRRFVKVHTTTSPRATAPSTFVPGTEIAAAPFRVHATLVS